MIKTPDDMRSDDRDIQLNVTLPHADIGAHAARSGTATLSAQAILFVLGLASTMVLARLLTPEEHGLIEMVLPIIGFITLFKDLGLSQATIQKDTITQGQVTNLFWVNVVVSALLMTITAACAPLVALFYKEPRLTMVVVVTAFGFFFGGLTVQHQAILRRSMRFRTLAAIDVAASVIGLAAGIAAALAGLSYWALVIRMLVTAAVTEAGVWFACDWRPGLPRRGSGAFSMLMFGAHITTSNILNYLSVYSANVLIGKFDGKAPVAFYGKARQLLLQPIHQINAPLSSVAIATLSRLQDDDEGYRRAYLRFLGAIAMLSMPLAAGLVATADLIVPVVLGAQWGQAVPLFAVMGAAAFILPAGNTTGWLFISQGRTRDIMRWGLIDGVLTVATIAAGTPWGVFGVAVGYAAGTCLVRMPLLFWLAGRKGPVSARHIWDTLVLPALASGVTLASVTAVRHLLAGSTIPGITSTLTGQIVQLAILVIMGGITALAVYITVPASRLVLTETVSLLRKAHGG